MSGDYDFCAVCGKATYECAGHAPALEGDRTVSEKCGVPLGFSENLDVYCEREKGHEGGHAPHPAPAVSRSGEQEADEKAWSVAWQWGIKYMRANNIHLANVEMIWPRLLAAYAAHAIAGERERCAKIAERERHASYANAVKCDECGNHTSGTHDLLQSLMAEQIAAAIREGD